MCECARARVCVHSRALYEMGQGYSRGKKTPPYLIPHPTSRLCLSKLDFILQKQSGMNNSFSSPCFCFFFISFLFLAFLLHSFLAFLSFCLSFFLPYPARVKVLPFCPSAKDLVEFVHGLVISAVVCLHRFS